MYMETTLTPEVLTALLDFASENRAKQIKISWREQSILYCKRKLHVLYLKIFKARKNGKRLKDLAIKSDYTSIRL